LVFARSLASLFVLAIVAVPAQVPTPEPALVQRVIARVEPPPDQVRALRRLEARNEKFNKEARMTVWTEADRTGGFRYQIVSEEGSGYIRSKVFHPALDTEQKMWADGDPQRAAMAHDNYTFEELGTLTDGLASLAIRPRRKDVLLVDGTIFVTPHDGDLMRIEGRLSKTPSFWTRRVDVVRQYARIGGVHVPVSLESVASVLIAGKSTFKMTYEYESINGKTVGTPDATR
jgi:hypothetical protein